MTMQVSNKLITVITVVRNGESHIESAINSVISQKDINIEYIVIDGLSTDGTMKIVKKYRDHIDIILSEEDEGIYSAMNKGINMARGKYIGFINADDWYSEGALLKVVEFANSDYSFIFGDVRVVSECLSEVNIIGNRLSDYRWTMPFGHPALFVKAEIIKKHRFNESYKICADYDFCIKMINESSSYKYLQTCIANFRLGGVSTSENVRKELFQIQVNHFGLSYALYWYLLRVNNRFLTGLLRYSVAPVVKFIRILK